MAKKQQVIVIKMEPPPPPDPRTRGEKAMAELAKRGLVSGKPALKSKDVIKE